MSVRELRRIVNDSRLDRGDKIWFPKWFEQYATFVNNAASASVSLRNRLDRGVLAIVVAVNYMHYSGGTDEKPNPNDSLARIGRFQNLDPSQTESDSASTWSRGQIRSTLNVPTNESDGGDDRMELAI